MSNSATETQTATRKYVDKLTKLGSGELGQLRARAGCGLDEDVDGFDLFAGLWWPLRRKSQHTPRREVAWLVAKLYAFRRVPHQPDATLARQLGRCRANKDPAKRKRFDECFDGLLSSTISLMELHLQWALGEVQRMPGAKVDWARLTDDLSGWHSNHVRQTWINDYLNTNKETSNAD